MRAYTMMPFIQQEMESNSTYKAKESENLISSNWGSYTSCFSHTRETPKR